MKKKPVNKKKRPKSKSKNRKSKKEDDMSWSVNFSGTPEEVVNSLENYSASLDGIAKSEFDAVKANLVGLVGLNKGKDKKVSINASGSKETESTGNIKESSLTIILK